MSDHIVPVKIYMTIFLVLMLLTAVTVWVAFHDFGVLNVVVALAIASIKATLVVLYFMHVRYSSRLTQVIVAASLFWFLILVAFTLSDYWTRGWQNV